MTPAARTTAALAARVRRTACERFGFRSLLPGQEDELRLADSR